MWVGMTMRGPSHPIVACCIGDRSETTCTKLWEQIPPTYGTSELFAPILTRLPMRHPRKRACRKKEALKKILKSAKTTSVENSSHSLQTWHVAERNRPNVGNSARMLPKRVGRRKWCALALFFHQPRLGIIPSSGTFCASAKDAAERCN
jgi:hypothetical protein